MSADGKPALTKSTLVALITRDQPHLSEQDVELAVNSILERMTAALVSGERIEIRNFGSMSLHYRPARIGRNPKTGEAVRVPEKYAPHFKPGAALRRRVNAGKGAGRKS
ncbi:MAG: integration host factor subunit beta [Gammaproteobacteria bacterium]|nr:integration host factor subunit beta [Gammaproteobacteria bacterium]MDA7969288.1 integration host factor subunit beta [Gammaproteobacteria bacterium]MDA7971423.1 integration host factor subunit beta [Gammaproteobacteria bacterium]MDA7994728.1 integration host factor subunit beta [Gammaproteobacteria bacterium]CAJ2376682.1 MAG: integration host factor subunit beta [Arenicellales bacterium IbO2]